MINKIVKVIQFEENSSHLSVWTAVLITGDALVKDDYVL